MEPPKLGPMVHRWLSDRFHCTHNGVTKDLSIVCPIVFLINNILEPGSEHISLDLSVARCPVERDKRAIMIITASN